MTTREQRQTPQQLFNDAVLRLVAAERRVDPYVRPLFDTVLRPPVQALTQAALQARLRHRRPRTPVALAQEQPLPGEAEATAEIIEVMSRFLRHTYKPGTAQRAGNTKTYGVVKASLQVHGGLPPRLRQGLFAHPSTYPAWVRFAGPGPLSPPDLDDNGILSIGVKVVGVPGPKLLDDEKHTQDFTGISAPTFTTPNVVENVKLQRRIGDGTPLLYFLGPKDSHLADLVMQGLYARTHSSPLETAYWSCASYLLGEGQAMQYRFVPRDRRRGRLPRHPPDDYLRDALARTLHRREVFFDLLVQPQTDPVRMPIEDASVVWPERLSRPVRVATLRIERQELDPAEQRARADGLSVNPWHALPEHRPLGNQNRARREVYVHLSRLRQEMNGTPHVEPGAGTFFG
ncbi:hypothetical protein [Streptomyces fulvoviolaceus]|uniref:hypothetical protein n=1 Tax=Streptomyces fulvoviolaceus TaxID=285535 RepID=UPI0004CA1A4E|nr:hypothetical protein [Streptomyces fulvoviolaceus]